VQVVSRPESRLAWVGLGGPGQPGSQGHAWTPACHMAGPCTTRNDSQVGPSLARRTTFVMYCTLGNHFQTRNEQASDKVRAKRRNEARTDMQKGPYNEK